MGHIRGHIRGHIFLLGDCVWDSSKLDCLLVCHSTGGEVSWQLCPHSTTQQTTPISPSCFTRSTCITHSKCLTFHTFDVSQRSAMPHVCRTYLAVSGQWCFRIACTGPHRTHPPHSTHFTRLTRITQPAPTSPPSRQSRCSRSFRSPPCRRCPSRTVWAAAAACGSDTRTNQCRPPA
jgi:hypothetical protein